MFDKKFIIIAVDGGAASGKSSTSKILAERRNLLYVDTGAHYRTLSYILLKRRVYPEDHKGIVEKLESFRLDTQIVGRAAQMVINDDVFGDEFLRSAEVNQSVSQFSAMPEIREFLLKYQRSLRSFAFEHCFDGLIMEGRDIGSVVLPDADFRFFLEADVQKRMERRQLQGGGVDAIHARDQMDVARKTAPLICPENAIRINTSELSLEEVVDSILKIINA